MFLFWLVACNGGGSVTLSKGDAFGHVASAWWTGDDVIKLWSLDAGMLIEEGDAVTAPAIRLFSEPTMCEDLQADYQSWIDTSAFLLGSADPCLAMPDALAELAAEPLPTSPNRVLLSYCDGDNCADVPTPGTYTDRSELGVSGGVRRNDEDAAVEFARLTEAWDPEACAFGETQDPSEWLEFDTIELILDEADEERRVVGSFQGHLLNAALEDAGTAAGDFSAGWCEMPDAEDLVLFDWSGW